MQHTVSLSDKAWAFVESRRGPVSADTYLSTLIENLEELSKDYHPALEDSRIVDLIESYAPPLSALGAGGSTDDHVKHREIARATIDYLRDAYNDRVPRKVFEKKCVQRGLSHVEVLEAVNLYARWLV